MLNPAPGTGPNLMGTLSQGVQTSQDILLHVLRANAQVLDTTRDLLNKIADTLEANRMPPKGPSGPNRPEQVKVTKSAPKAT